jgi:hypothetical protein
MECKPRYERLASEVRDVLKSRVEREGWFFFSRIKSDESFAQKIETGRVPDPERMEDFFACSIVVPTISSIHEAEGLVLQSYDCQERRPDDDRITRKDSSYSRMIARNDDQMTTGSPGRNHRVFGSTISVSMLPEDHQRAVKTQLSMVYYLRFK